VVISALSESKRTFLQPPQEQVFLMGGELLETVKKYHTYLFATLPPDQWKREKDVRGMAWKNKLMGACSILVLVGPLENNRAIARYNC